MKAAGRVKEGSRERVEGLLAACARETCSEGHRSTKTDVGVGGKEREWEARSPWYFICCYRWRNNGRVRTARVPGPKMGTMAVCTCLAPHNQFYCRRRSSRSAGSALRWCSQWDNDERSSRTMEEVWLRRVLCPALTSSRRRTQRMLHSRFPKMESIAVLGRQIRRSPDRRMMANDGENTCRIWRVWYHHGDQVGWTGAFRPG